MLFCFSFNFWPDIPRFWLDTVRAAASRRGENGCGNLEIWCRGTILRIPLNLHAY
jgi:hypothetical protein